MLFGVLIDIDVDGGSNSSQSEWFYSNIQSLKVVVKKLLECATNHVALLGRKC